MIRLFAAVAATALTACATPLTSEGQRVRVVTEQQRPACQFLGMVNVQKSLGQDKPGSALNEAMNRTGAMGGNGFFIVTNAVHVFDGASIAGEALKCPDRG